MKGFKNALVYVDGSGIIRTDLSIDNDGLIAKIGKLSEEGLKKIPDDVIVFPSFIDEHIHGAGGRDVMDGTVEALKTISDTLIKEGTTGFLATTMTQSRENIFKALDAVKEFSHIENQNGADLLGVHLEGPYISESYAGAQPVEFIKNPNISEFEEFVRRSGSLIKIVTIAPEKEGATKFIARLKELGIVASIGHTSASRKDIEEAVLQGATNVTHTFNAQSPMKHRDIGTAGSALLEDGLCCEVIVDGVHVSYPAIKILLKAKPHDKIVLITDAMRAKQTPDGISELGGQKVVVKNGEARLLSGALAGSVLKMNDAVKNLVNLGVCVTDAIDFASKNPAKNLGVFNERGSVKEGKRADFVLLDKDFQVFATIKEGKPLFGVERF